MAVQRVTVLTTLAAAAGLAAAQVPTTGGSVPTYTLSWREAPGGNGDGVLQPGESALLSFTVSFTGQNTVASFSPPVGGFSSGTIVGWSSGFVDLYGLNNAAGTWNVGQAQGLGIDPGGGWDFTNGLGNGTVQSGGADLVSIQFGQLPATPAQVNTQNPIGGSQAGLPGVWNGIWTPSTYSSRTVTFTLAPALAGGGMDSAVLFQVSPTQLVAAHTQVSHLGLVNIPIQAPAPGGLALLGLTLLGRRRRR